MSGGPEEAPGNAQPDDAPAEDARTDEARTDDAAAADAGTTDLKPAQSPPHERWTAWSLATPGRPGSVVPADEAQSSTAGEDASHIAATRQARDSGVADEERIVGTGEEAGDEEPAPSPWSIPLTHIGDLADLDDEWDTPSADTAEGDDKSWPDAAVADAVAGEATGATRIADPDGGEEAAPRAGAADAGGDGEPAEDYIAGGQAEDATITGAVGEAPASGDGATTEGVTTEGVTTEGTGVTAAPVITTEPAGRNGTLDQSDGTLDQKVTIVPGVARYHRSGCILIRFLSENDLETSTRREAEAAGCVACRACEPNKPQSADSR